MEIYDPDSPGNRIKGFFKKHAAWLVPLGLFAAFQGISDEPDQSKTDSKIEEARAQYVANTGCENGHTVRINGQNVPDCSEPEQP